MVAIVTDIQKLRKKKTLASLGDGDSYNDKLNKKKQPHK